MKPDSTTTDFLAQGFQLIVLGHHGLLPKILGEAWIPSVVANELSSTATRLPRVTGTVGVLRLAAERGLIDVAGNVTQLRQPGPVTSSSMRCCAAGRGRLPGDDPHPGECGGQLPGHRRRRPLERLETRSLKGTGRASPHNRRNTRERRLIPPITPVFGGRRHQAPVHSPHTLPEA